MEHEHFTIEIDGAEADDLYPDLVGLEVELDEEMAAMFRMRIAIMQQPDGLWTYLDDDRFTVWKGVTITAGFESGADELISGYVTHVKPVFDPDPSRCMLLIWGMDESVRMDREEVLKDWPNKKDSDIASEIFGLYGFSPDVEDSAVIHDEAVSTIIQRETDMQFLRRLALRNGYECYVEGGTGYFRTPQVDADPQPILAVHFGDETNVNRLSLEVDALAPANISMYQVDRSSKEVLSASVETSSQTTLGETGAADLTGPGIQPGKMYVSMSVATGTLEMEALCRGGYHRGEWFVTAEGEIAGNKYGHALMPRRTVTIKGIGETHSGMYYVTHVVHSFTADGYTQSFMAKRNALMPSGTEDFSSGSGFGL
jgi:phage protein D